MNLTKNSLFRILLATVVVAFGACSPTKPVAPAGSEQISQSLPTKAQGEKIGQRAVQRWENIINKKFDDAYEMLSPGYRQTHNKKDYVSVIANRPVQWTKATYIDHECQSPDVCTIRVNIEFDFMMPTAGRVKSENPVLEKWLRVENEWYFFPDNIGK